MMNKYRTRRGITACVLAAALALPALSVTGCKTAGNVPAADISAENSLSAHIKKITYMAEGNRSIVKIFGSRKFEYTAYKLADPLRLAVEIPGAELDFEPRHIPVDGKIISGMMVVRFPKVKSVRLEMELLADAPFKLTQKSGYLEVQLTEGIPSVQPRAPQTPAADAAAEKETSELETLRAEAETLRTDNLALRKDNVRLDEENQKLKKDQAESAKQMEEATALSRSMQARIAFMEDQVSVLQAKVGNSAPEKSPDAGTSVALGGGAAVVPVPVPAPAPLPAPIAAPRAANQKPDDEKVKMAVSETVAAWLNAWREKDLGKYASYYTQDFRGQGMSLDAWLADKKAKFSSTKKLTITADNVKIGLEPDGAATVVFEQSYQSGSYRDHGLKRLRLRNPDGKWQILSEEWSPL